MGLRPVGPQVAQFDFPAEDWYWPFGHDLQLTEFIPSANFPVLQFLQEFCLARFWYLPLLQEEHTPAEGAYFPLAQLMQTSGRVKVVPRAQDLQSLIEL
jgi:hypothetical protein